MGTGIIMTADGYIVTNNHVIEKATKIARKMVLEYGFSSKLGAIKWDNADAQDDYDGLKPRPYSERTAEIIGFFIILGVYCFCGGAGKIMDFLCVFIQNICNILVLLRFVIAENAH